MPDQGQESAWKKERRPPSFPLISQPGLTCSMEFLLLLSQGGEVFLAELPFLEVSQKCSPRRRSAQSVLCHQHNNSRRNSAYGVACQLLQARLRVPWPHLFLLAQADEQPRPGPDQSPSVPMTSPKFPSHTHTNQFQANHTPPHF
jgi:hypothetical protein